ncbi:MAG: CCA tRNA nucleotidyltransferase [Parcubacteria group bacterium]|nr:CCA tRNA nucleotidyltransferase [Parcubacteria group bacterium]
MLKDGGFEAYLVGGCVRELLREKQPKDWDITTNATPEEIIKVFEHTHKTFYENDYGTVGVVIEEWQKKTENTISVTHETSDFQARETNLEINKEINHNMSHIVEITPYRLEAKYSDSRHPDKVIFSKNIEDDLKRRDFTMNAIAYEPNKGHIIDLYAGQKDIKDKVIRAVGNPEERFSEDALRIVRGVRLATELGFEIETETKEAISKTNQKLANISAERIRDEFVKIVMSDHPMFGIELSHELGILKYIIPELETGIGIEQNAAHAFHVWEHNLRTLQHGAKKNWTLKVRIAALLHDVAKPQTRRWSNEKNNWTFYGHDVVGARVAEKVMTRLKFPKKLSEDVVLLVRYHLFFSDTEKITHSAVRRIVRSVGNENIWDLMKVRACDRIGTGRPKENPYRLRKYEAMIEEVMRDPISVGALKIDGAKIMEMTGEKPGRRIGWVLHALLEEVIDDPKKNTDAYLAERTKILFALSDKELEMLGRAAKEKKEETEEAEVKEIRKRHWVE